MQSTFFTWFKDFSNAMRSNHGLCVTIRDKNAIMYRVLYDRGYTPEKAALLIGVKGQ